MGAKGTALLDFGIAGSHLTSVTVTGQTGIASDSACEAFVMSEPTSDGVGANAYEQRMAPIRLTCGDIVAGVGFTIYAVSEWTLSRTYAVRWVWA